MAIFATINHFPEATGGLELYANIGNKDRSFPTSDNYDVVGESIFWGGEGLYFSKSDFNEEKSWIKIYLSISAGMEVELSSRLVNGNIFSVSL